MGMEYGKKKSPNLVQVTGTHSPPTTQHPPPNQVSPAVLVLLVRGECRDIDRSGQGPAGCQRAFWFSQENVLPQDGEQSHHACE